MQAVDAAGSNPDKIRDALEHISNFKAVSGAPAKPYSAKDHECLDADDVFLGVWRDGKVVRLK